MKTISIIVMSIAAFVPSILTMMSALFFMLLGMAMKDKRTEAYGFRILVSVDQLYNAIFYGSEDETISSRAGKKQDTKVWAKILCWFLNKLDTDHCKKSIEEDESTPQY